jgi:hypothetical protein
MKITDNMGNLFTQSAKRSSQKTNREQTFSEVLDRIAQGPVEGSSGLKASTGVPPLGAFDSITLSEPVGALSQSEGESPHAAGIIDELETILHAFDHYRVKLGDVSTRADDLADIIGHLEDRIDRLQALNNSATTPEGLKDVTSGLMITMATEIEKFWRGDYA